MKRRMITVITMLALVFSLSGICTFAFDEVPSGRLSVEYDDGNGTVFASLPTNYAKLRLLSLDDAVIVSGSGYSITNAQAGTANKPTKPHLVWTGKLTYGGDIRNTTKDAVLKKNSLPEVTLKFPKGAELSDGRDADVIIKFDNINVNVTKSFNSKITSNTTVKVLIAASDAYGLWLVAASPKTAIDKWDYTSADKSTSAGAAHRVRTTITLTEPEEGKVIGKAVSSADYPSMLVEFKDLDVRDTMIKSNASYTEQWNGPFAEGIEMESGWGNPVALAPMGKDIVNQSLVDKQIINGNTKIKGSGGQYQALEAATGKTNDSLTFYSGFAAPVKPDGFSFYWTGSIRGGAGSSSNVATVITGQPTVAVRAKRSEGGSLGNETAGTYSGLDSWYNNTHLMNSAGTYNYKPDEGWCVEYLKVDGEEQELTEEQKLHGGSYIFERLNKNPIPKREYVDGNILDAEDSGYYTIEVKYARLPSYTVTKTSDKQMIKSMSDEEITYTIKCTEETDKAQAGTHQIKDDLAGGVLKIVPDSLTISTTEGSSYKVDKNDENGLWVTFESAEASDHKPEMTITYKATVNWDKYKGGKIINTAEKPNEIEVVNNLIIAKSVTGKLRDTSKQFKFSAVIKGLEPGHEYQVVCDGAEIKDVKVGSESQYGFKPNDTGEAELVFGIKGDQTVSILNLPMSSKYLITEEGSDHIASYVQSSDQSKPVFAKAKADNTESGKTLSTETETLEAADGEVTVKFTNRRDPVPVTGIVSGTDFLFPGMMLAFCGAWVLYILGRNKKRGEQLT